MSDTVLQIHVSLCSVVPVSCDRLNQGERQTLPGHPECSDDVLFESVSANGQKNILRIHLAMI